MVAENMIPETQINDFVGRLRKAAGENLQSVILYGSAAGGEFHPEFSNLNLLCILRETTFPAISALASSANWWTRRNHPAPLLLTHEELERSADVFSIELLDMRRRYRVLFGEDVLAGLQVPMHLHRAQVEYELREKLIVLRQQMLLAGRDEKRLWELMLRSVSAFTTLFRHALIALGETAPDSKRVAVQALAARTGFDASAMLQLLDIRERKLDRRQLEVVEVLTRYLAAVQQVVAAIDTMLDSSVSR